MTTKSGTPRYDWSIPFLLFWPTLFAGGLLAMDFLPEWRAKHFYEEGRCVVFDKRVVEHGPSGKAMNSTYRPEFLIRYKVAGQEYQAWAYKAVKASTPLRWPKERVLGGFTVGQEYPCWYDPADPSKVVVVRGYNWFSYALMPPFFVLVFFTGRGVLRTLRAARAADDVSSGEESGPGRSGAADREAITTSPGPTSGRPPRPVGVTVRPRRRGWGQGPGDG